MDFRRASKVVAYGSRRRRALVAAVLFPLPLIHSMIGNIRLEGWTLGNTFSLAASLGIYLALIVFLASPIKCWWAFRVALGVIVGACSAWVFREISYYFMALPPAPVFAWALVIVIGALSLSGIFKPPPDPKVEQQFVADEGFRQPVAWWLSALFYAVFLIPLLLLMRSLYFSSS
jgi:hypothetical protein